MSKALPYLSPGLILLGKEKNKGRIVTSLNKNSKGIPISIEVEDTLFTSERNLKREKSTIHTDNPLQLNDEIRKLYAPETRKEEINYVKHPLFFVLMDRVRREYKENPVLLTLKGPIPVSDLIVS